MYLLRNYFDVAQYIIAADEESLKIDALTQAEIAEIQLDQFKQNVVSLIFNTLTCGTGPKFS